MCEMHQDNVFRKQDNSIFSIWTLLESLLGLGALAAGVWGFSFIPEHIVKSGLFMKTSLGTILLVTIFLFWRSGRKARNV